MNAKKTMVLKKKRKRWFKPILQVEKVERTGDNLEAGNDVLFQAS